VLPPLIGARGLLSEELNTDFLIGIMVKKTFRIWLTRELIAEIEVRRDEKSILTSRRGYSGWIWVSPNRLELEKVLKV
jgi:hypothetical protein